MECSAETSALARVGSMIMLGASLIVGSKPEGGVMLCLLEGVGGLGGGRDSVGDDDVESLVGGNAWRWGGGLFSAKDRLVQGVGKMVLAGLYCKLTK